MSEIMECYLKTLSPVHIGCDEVYEPMGFAVDEQAQSLVVFNPEQFLASLSAHQRSKFSAICMKGTISSILELYGFLRGQKAPGRQIPVCPGFLEHYGKTLAISARDERKIQQELNRFQIGRTAYLPGRDRPYIPGSSVKGAIRTAYLNLLDGQEINSRSPSGYRPHMALEAKLLDYDPQRIETDPFRMVKVSDFLPVGEAATHIGYAVNMKKRPTEHDAMGPPQILEMIEPGMWFRGVIRVDRPEPKAPIRKPVSLEDLLRSIGQFYLARKTEEDGTLRDLGVVTAAMDAPDHGRLIRVGRHSGAEAVTIERHRSIRIMQKGGPPREGRNATTLWLSASDRNGKDVRALKPFGWMVLGEVKKEQATAFDGLEEAFLKEVALAGPGRPTTTIVKPPPPPPQEVMETWESAALTWNAGNHTLTASAGGGKKAVCNGLDCVSEDIASKLKKKKNAKGRVTVLKEGAAYFKIKKVE